jgi:type II secretory pathway predicted ATPase ExeA
MFEAFYGMSGNPFDKAAPKDACFPSNDFKESTGRLRYATDKRGVVLLTSPPGGGKTYVFRQFAESLNPNLHQVAYICMSSVSTVQFYRQLCEALGVETSQAKSSMFASIQAQLYALYKSRQPFILALDEAHDLDTRILKDIKMLLNHGFDSINTFTLILLGEPHLNNILEKPVHESLRQRLIVHYNFEGLSSDETTAYITHKLDSVGASSEAIMGDGTLAAIHGHTRGRPRLVDSLMTDLLILGAQQKKETVDTDTVYAAINNQTLQ